MKKRTGINTEKYVGIAIFSALAFVVALLCNVIPPIAGFLSLDVKDSVIAIASFIYGPIAAVAISFLAALIELITFSTTGWYGFVMNFASSAVFSLTASLIYSRIRNINGALISFFAAVITTTGVMLLLNKFVTPIYLFDYLGAMPEAAAREYVTSILPTVLLPFNFAKSLLNSAVAMMLYKPLSRALKKAKHALADTRRAGTKEAPIDTPAPVVDPISFNRNSVIILAVGSVALLASVLILVFL